jgi:hypothetical protein
MIHQFGMDFPDGTDDATKLLAAYRATMDPDKKAGFMYRTIQTLWSEDQYKLHYWVKRRVEA